MAFSINLTDPNDITITVPKTDLTLVSGTLYEHDTETFRQELIDWEDSEIGMSFPRTHTHNTTVTIVGLTLARVIELIAPYSIEFEDGPYSVKLVGSNNNLFDVEGGILKQNQVQIISNNSAGLQVVATSSGLSAAQAAQLVIIEQILRNTNKTDPVTGRQTIATDDGLNIALEADLFEDADGTIIWDGTTPINRRDRLEPPSE
jgi:hypothetical protein